MLALTEAIAQNLRKRLKPQLGRKRRWFDILLTVCLQRLRRSLRISACVRPCSSRPRANASSILSSRTRIFDCSSFRILLSGRSDPNVKVNAPLRKTVPVRIPNWLETLNTLEA
jgi:hypothetical protein